jgi:hypothetical protein
MTDGATPDPPVSGSGQQLAGQGVMGYTLDSSDEFRAPTKPASDLFVRLPAFPQSQHPRFHRPRRSANSRARARDGGPADDPVDVLCAATNSSGDLFQRETLTPHGEDPPLDRSD